MSGLHSTKPIEIISFEEHERQSRANIVRIYCALTIVILLVYGLIIPLFFTYENEVKFSLLLFPMIAVLGAYIALTLLPAYYENLKGDFGCLLAIGVLMLGENYILWDEASISSVHQHSNIAINTSLVTAFASIVMSERIRWFIVWLTLHALAFSILLVFSVSELVEILFASLSYVTGASIAIFIASSLGHANHAASNFRKALEVERAKTEDLLFNVLPQSAVLRLKQGEIVADSYPDASVVFIDVVGFSNMATRVSPGHLIEMLNSLFSLADRCAAGNGIEKVKTIGDAYLAIAGGNVPAVNSADTAIEFSQAVIAGLTDLQAGTGLPVEVRIGIHTGPVVGGVIGSTRMAYDYWGETMNMASRIEGTAAPCSISISESTFLRTSLKSNFGSAEKVALKGVGKVLIYRMRTN